MSSIPMVTIVVPALNEEQYIRRAIESLLPQDNSIDFEVIVLDGGSTDRTRQIVTELAAADRRIRLASNSARLQSAAVNKGARLAKAGSNTIIRADAHSVYPPGFAVHLVRELQVRRAGSVVVPLRAAGITPFQRAVAAAQNCRLGNGGSPHRSKVASRYVDHGHHAAFDRAVFLSVGGYDETFSHNEDAELDLRLIGSGAKIWLSSELAITYFTRPSIMGLARQFFNYGSGRARTILKHRSRPKARQLLPVAVLAMNCGSVIMSIAGGGAFLIPLIGYFSVCTIWSIILARRNRDAACLASGIAAAVMHHSWGAGFLHRFVKIFIASPQEIRQAQLT